MESTGAPGRIQMTRVAADLVALQNPKLKDRIRRRPGQVQIRGKQDMQTFWLYTDEELEAAPLPPRLTTAPTEDAEVGLLKLGLQGGRWRGKGGETWV